MFTSFDLKLDKYDFLEYNTKDITGFLDKNNNIMETFLNEFIGVDGSIAATKLKNAWFPDIKADIFLSHSHADEAIAKGLAGFLYQEFGLKTFIDSCVWGFCDDLLKEIDDKYCKNDNEETYSYEKRNYSTSHVHMMLSIALSEMMDKTECIFFLNTPNALTSKESIQKTKSPWIYNEIAMSNIIRRKDKTKHRDLLIKATMDRITEATLPDFEYDLELKNFIKLNMRDLQLWKHDVEISIQAPDTYNLDYLYKIKNVTNK